MLRHLLYVAVTCLLFACEKDEPAPFNILEGVTELLYATNFEDPNQLVEDGWTGNYDFTSGGPNENSIYALEVNPQWVPETGFARLTLPAPAGDYIIRFWSKTDAWEGTLTVSAVANGSEPPASSSSAELNSEDWEFQMLEITVAEGESLRLDVSAGSTEVVSGRVFVDDLFIGRE